MATRREFLLGTAPLAAAGAALAATGPTGAAVVVTLGLSRRPHTPLATAQPGDILTAESWNAMVEALNELRERQ